jgi:hypothetical protein
MKWLLVLLSLCGCEDPRPKTPAPEECIKVTLEPFERVLNAGITGVSSQWMVTYYDLNQPKREFKIKYVNSDIYCMVIKEQ